MRPQNSENAMAGKVKINQKLQAQYDLPRQEKFKYIETPEERLLFDGLPAKVSEKLKEGFLSGAHGVDIDGWDIVTDYFRENSEIIPALTKNPGTFAMLERMYHFEPSRGVIDNYFLKCKSGGQALRNRYQTVTAKACEHVSEMLAENGKCLMIDIGSGPGRNGIDMCRQMPNLNGNIRIDCIDIDPEAIEKGMELVHAYRIKQIEFVQKSMTRLHSRYPGNVDYGLLIGILCGLTKEERIGLLSAIKPYFRKGAKLVAASLLDRMADEDLLCAYILRETTCWGLQYPPIGELKEVFEMAGWKSEEFFQEEPTKFYEIGVAIA